MPARGYLNAALDIDLVTEKRECCPERFSKFFLQLSNLADRFAAKFRGHFCQPLVRVISRQCHGNDRRTDHFRIMGRQVSQSFFQDLAVVDLRAKHDLSMYLDVVIEKTLKLSGNVSPFFIDAQQISASLEISRMNRNVLRRQTL